jgi:3-deoxy-manno-octulosonate cytidylyltransferase (CMP-KDO synthetase)
MPELPRQGYPPCCIIIPARFGSTRYPGKPLARLRGAGGQTRTLIEWSWLAASAVPGVEQLCVATDDRRIAEEVTRFGGTAIMTPPECANGTERCAAAFGQLRTDAAVIVNFQGDAPLTPPSMVVALLQRMHDEPGLAVATPVVRCTEETRRHLLDDRAAGRVGGTTVVGNRQGHALYFSKEVIPFGQGAQAAAVQLHIGVYAYRRAALTAYAQAPASDLELSEGLEQLRFLDQGVAVGIVPCPAPEGLMAELNNPHDLAPIEAELARRSPVSEPA